MTPEEILVEMVAIRQRILDRYLRLSRETPGAVSEESIDLCELDLLSVKLQLAQHTAAIKSDD